MNPKNRIKIMLAVKEMPAKKLAEKMDITVFSVARWCTNKRQPTIKHLYEIAEILDVSVLELLVDNKKTSK